MQQATTAKRAVKNETIVERTSDRELVVTRTFDAPAHIVFDAWTKPELLKRWWAPKSFGVSLFECEQDVRVGGAYRFAFGRDPKNPEVFTGRYLEVDPPSRLVLTQLYERMSDVGDVVVTAAFEESQGTNASHSAPALPEQGSLGRRIGVGHGARHACDARSARRAGRRSALTPIAAHGRSQPIAAPRVQAPEIAWSERGF